MFQIPSEDEILEQVDEYLLYCFYTRFEPELRRKYKCPFREDSSPSWTLMQRLVRRGNSEFCWKDQGSGRLGDIFELVMLICKLPSRGAAIGRVREDFIFNKKQALPEHVDRPVNKPARIKIKSKAMTKVDLQWWSEFGIDEKLLRRYHVTRVAYYWMYEDQATPSFPSDACYAYRIYDHYKLYFPHRSKDFRFRNDYGDAHLEGFCQLEFNTDLLIRTKSLKDVMVLRSLGYEAISPRGEHSVIHPVFEDGFRKRYKRHLTLFDNDGKHRGWDYDMAAIEVPLDSGEKDISDYYKRYGREKTSKLLDHMISNHPYMSIDLNKPMTRPELEAFLEKVYLGQVIAIQERVTSSRQETRKQIAGKVDRLSVDFDPKSSSQTQEDLVCIIQIAGSRYEFPITYFLQKAQIFKHGDL